MILFVTNYFGKIVKGWFDPLNWQEFLNILFSSCRKFMRGALNTDLGVTLGLLLLTLVIELLKLLTLVTTSMTTS